MNKSVVSNLKTILSVLLRCVLVLIIYSAVILMFKYISGDFSKKMFSSNNLIMIAMLLEFMIILIVTISIDNCYKPIMLSFSSTRKGYFFTKYLLIIMSNIIIAGVVLVLNIVKGFDGIKFAYYVAGILFITALCTVMSLITDKFGRVGYFIFCILVGFMSGFLAAVLPAAAETNLLQILHKNVVVVTVVAISLEVIISVICAILSYKELLKYEIR